MNEKMKKQIEQMSLAISFAIQNMDAFSDEQALAVSEIYPAWHIGVDYRQGQVARFESKLWRCVQNHTSQTTWEPSKAPSLWSEISYNQNGVENWKQPTGAHDAYNVGDRVAHNGKIWESLTNGNVWEPSDAVPTLWQVVE